MEVSALRPRQDRTPLTPEQKEAWEHLAETFGEERYALEWCSYREAAEAGVSAMIEEADKLIKHESVRKAYDHFMLMCELTKDYKDT
jgi:hypothetical protein